MGSHEKPPIPPAREVFTDPHHLFAFGFGSGLSRFAPGTMGTALAIVPYLLMAHTLTPVTYLIVLVAASLFGFWVCNVSSKKLGVHDHGGIVWDEFVGFWITMLPVFWVGETNPLWIVAGFVVFRIFDVLKPFPIGWLDRRVGGGFGIMIDDIIAGIDGAVVLLAAQWYMAGRFDHLL